MFSDNFIHRQQTIERNTN